MTSSRSHELGGRHAPHAIVEAQHHHAIHAEGLQGLELFPQPRQPRRRCGPLEVLAWGGLERDHDRRHGELRRTLAQRRDDVLVAAVNAVVVADRGDAAAMTWREVVQASNEVHGRNLALREDDGAGR